MAAFGYQIWIFGAIIADFHFITIEDLQALINHQRLMKMAVEGFFSLLLIAEREEERLKNDRWECKKKKYDIITISGYFGIVTQLILTLNP